MACLFLRPCRRALACSALVFAGGVALSGSVGAVDDAGSVAAATGAELPLRPVGRDPQADLRAYRDMIAKLEAKGGAFDAGLAEPLLGLGLSLQRAGDHAAAIEAFKRGAHLARINDGLYTERQVALLQGEIASHIALGELDVADERQRYLYRVQVKVLEDVPRSIALMQHAAWQRRAFEARLDEDPGQRLLRMWSLNQLALTDIARTEGETSAALLDPLYGMLQAQYLMTGIVGETSSGQYLATAPFGDWEEQQRIYRVNAYSRGASVIRAIYDVRRAQPRATLADTADAMLMLGDWQLWNGKRIEALETYAELERELAAVETAQDLRSSYFSEPRALPTLPGVRGMPLPLQPSEAPGALLVQFGVNERGKVVDVERLDSEPANDALAGDVMRQLRRTLFRPRISDGIAVETTGIVRAYDISNW
jgi:hypothetical protein